MQFMPNVLCSFCGNATLWTRNKRMNILKQATSYLQQNGLITAELAPWFSYGLSRTLLSAVTYSVLLLLGWFLCGFLQTLVYLIAFASLRKYVGGWHASTPLRCLCCSILQVFLCLGVLYPVCMQMPYVTIMGISFLSGMSVIALAPLPPQKMHITTKEFTVLKKLARKVLVVETLLVCVLLPFRLTAFSLLVSLGMGCAAFSLWIAKPKKRRRNKP